MILNKELNITVVGLGVMGGGYAMSLSKKGYTVKAITLHQGDIDYALEKGMIAYGTTVVEEQLIKESDLIVFAIYPDAFIEWIKEYGHLIEKGTLITDVTGVKCHIVDTIQALLPEGVEFIAAHPMAGRERSGVHFADDAVFRNANFIVTPTEKNTKEAIDFAMALGEELGFARISILSPTEHDNMIAYLSQLTHIIAVTLMTANSTPNMEKYTGDSFRDLTRIAKINDKMWSELFMENREILLSHMDAFIDEFCAFRTMLAQGECEGMREKMRLSTARRGLFDKPKQN